MNNNIILEIYDIAHGGYGVGKHNGKIVFVPFAYPGDVAKVNIFSDKRRFSWGNIEKIISPSPHRVSPLCPYMGTCGGCMWGCLSYEMQLIWKKYLVQAALQKIIRLEKEINIVSENNSIYNYRTRVRLHSNGKIVGLYKFHSYEVVRISNCVIIHKNIIKIANNLKNIPKNVKLLITTHPYNDLSMIYSDRRIKIIENKYKNMYNYKNDSSEKLHFVIDYVPVVNGSFSQNSLILNSLLKSTVIDYLNISSGKILDLYCGSGNLTISLPSSSFEVIGVDIDPFAIEYAKKYSSFDYRVGNESVMKKIICSSKWDAIILDPPREGAKNLIDELKLANSTKIIYVSCNYITQCRDLEYLTNYGWRIEGVSIIDLYPHTPHIETVVLLTK